MATSAVQATAHVEPVLSEVYACPAQSMVSEIRRPVRSTSRRWRSGASKHTRGFSQPSVETAAVVERTFGELQSLRLFVILIRSLKPSSARETPGEPRTGKGYLSIRLRIWSMLVCGAVAVSLGALGVSWAAQSDVWPGYLYSPGHSSFADGAAVVTTTTAGTLQKVWSFQAPGPTMPGQPVAAFNASPTVANGLVYLGSNTGVFYAVNETSGAVSWSRFLGFQPKLTCSAMGIVSTAAVATDPSSGKSIVYVAGGDGYLYALDGSNGNIVWRSLVGQLPSSTSNDYFVWSSPVVSAGRVYIGVSSNCDNPFVANSGVQAFDQVTGQLAGEYDSVPAGLGGGVWTTPAVDPSGDLFVTTASGPAPPAPQGDMYSIVHLDPTLARIGVWTVPPAQRTGDSDFASSPTVFEGDVGDGPEELVAACNKNGTLYAWRSADIAAGPVWQLKVGIGTPDGTKACLPAPIFDGSRLYTSYNATTIGGVNYRGSARALDPDTGTVDWQTGLGGTVIGSPSLDGSGVMAAMTYSAPAGTQQGLYLIDSRAGAILNFIPTAGGFSQPVFAGNRIFVATSTGALAAYGIRTSGDVSPPTEISGLTAARVSDGSVQLSWTAASDNKGIASYRIFRSGGRVAAVSGSQTRYTDLPPSPSASYTYAIEAVDTSGNVSPVSPTQVVSPVTQHPLLFDGFETGTFSQWTGNFNMKIVTIGCHQGSDCAEAALAGQRAYATVQLNQEISSAYVDVWFDVQSQGANPDDLLALLGPSSESVARLILNAKGHVALLAGPNGVTYTSAQAPSENMWHELYVHIDVGSGISQVYLDGQKLYGLSQTADFGSVPVDIVKIGDAHSLRYSDTLYDDVSVDNQPK